MVESNRINYARRSFGKKKRLQSKSKTLNVLCGCYFCALVSIYVVFLVFLVVPMIFYDPAAQTPLGGSLPVASGGGTPDHCTEEDKKIHIIFSTGCNLFQHWQSEVLLNTAMKVGQCGRITRIVSGCEEREDEGEGTGKRWITHQGGKTDQLVPTTELKLSSHPNFEVHVTPMVPESKEFPWWNKPYSIAHFSEHAKLKDDEIIVILDPDEFFIHALSNNGSPYSHIIATNGVDEATKARAEFGLDVAKRGQPVAQAYGLGPRWLTLFDREKVCGKGSHCTQVQGREAENKYSVGPPYILHVDDFKKVAPKWLELMKPVYEADRGDMQADMYAYIMSAAHYRLPHTKLNHYMVSDVGCEDLEGWKWVEALPSMSCQNPRNDFPIGKFPPFAPSKESPLIPHLLHAAQHYKATHPKTGELWNIHKGHIPGQILDCDQPLIVSPPDDLFSLQVDKRQKRAAFMICWLTFAINEAVLDYRKKFCTNPLPVEKQEPAGGIHGVTQGGGGVGGGGESENYNSAKCVRMVVHRSEVPQCDSKTDPYCYPLAKKVC